MDTTNEKPVFKHDCDKCKFLGHYNKHDLYFDDSSITGPTVIARFSDDGPDYLSGLYFADFDLHIAEAKKRAIDKGYLKK